MAKSKITSIGSIFVISVVCSIFVGLIAWGSFDDPLRIFIAAGITFVAVLVSLLILRAVQKDDEVVPGVPRLK